MQIRVDMGCQLFGMELGLGNFSEFLTRFPRRPPTAFSFCIEYHIREYLEVPPTVLALNPINPKPKLEP